MGLAIVTGSTGIAAATARRLAREGRPVGVIGIDGETVEAMVAEVRDGGGAAVGAVADLRHGAATDTAFGTCVDAFGTPDAVVAVAGGSGRRFGDGPIDAMTDEAWREAFDLNATTLMTTARAGVRAMAGGSLHARCGRSRLVGGFHRRRIGAPRQCDHGRLERGHPRRGER